jgi:AcrR family transcriptional regulator
LTSVAAPPRERIRDAQRSRAAILAAAERLFAERGYGGASMSEIGAAAGLSRGAPGYLFGAKERLYADVLAAVFGRRQLATERAFAPVHAWCQRERGRDALADALARAADGYTRYLVEDPAFVALIMREELDGGARLRAASRSSTAIEDAFGALRRAGARRGIGRFRVEEAVLLFVALTFAPFSYRNTLGRAVKRDLASARARRRQAELVADQLMHLLCSGERARHRRR